jgi:RNA recognition motif-containing protein
MERHEMAKRLYVGNLPYSTTEHDLETLFSKVGSVESVTIVKSRDTGRSRGFAFVDMADESQASNALEAFNLKPVGGRYLNVNAVRAGDWEW